MKESKLVRDIKTYLNGLEGCKAIKFHGGAFAESGTPDVLCCYKGHFLALEAKVGKNKATLIQKRRLEEWAKAGATVAVVYSVEEAEEVVFSINNPS